MKSILIILTFYSATLAFGQDTLVRKDGSILTVQILELDKNKELIVYQLDGQETVVSFNALKSYILHSDLSTSSSSSKSMPFVVPIDSRLNFKSKSNIPYRYGPWSVSTNLTALFNFGPTNSRLTVEPEYQFHPKFSLKVPLMFGMFNNYETGVRTSSFLTSSSYGYSTPTNYPQMIELRRRQADHVVAQLGINPKFYPWEKDENVVSIYLGGALNFGLSDQYSVSTYQDLDTSVYINSFNDTITYWTPTTTEEHIENNVTNYFSYELLVGVDFHFGKQLSATFECGFTSLHNTAEPILHDKLYRRLDNGPYQLVYDELPNFYRYNRQYVKARFLITYRFGAVKK